MKTKKATTRQPVKTGPYAVIFFLILAYALFPFLVKVPFIEETVQQMNNSIALPRGGTNIPLSSELSFLVSGVPRANNFSKLFFASAGSVIRFSYSINENMSGQVHFYVRQPDNPMDYSWNTYTTGSGKGEFVAPVTGFYRVYAAATNFTGKFDLTWQVSSKPIKLPEFGKTPEGLK